MIFSLQHNLKVQIWTGSLFSLRRMCEIKNWVIAQIPWHFIVWDIAQILWYFIILGRP